MKKTLVAMAVLAASGASFAQVTITGEVTMGYDATTNGAGATKSGLGIDTTVINFNATEDLGGGAKISAILGFDGVNRGGVNGGDTKLIYTNNSFGQITLASAKAGSYFGDVAEVGAPTIGWDGKLQQVETSYDSISYAVPVGPVVLGIKRNEGSSSTLGSALGIGIGDAGSKAPHNTQLTAFYSGGSLKLLGVYRTYDNQRASADVNEQMAATKDYVYNLQGAYDFGVAKVGLGYQFARGSNGTQITDTELAFNVPVGAWDFGASFVTANASNAPDTSAFNAGVPALTGFWNISKYNGSQSGASFGARYNFSKRTNITLKYASWTYSGYAQFEADAAAGGGYGRAGLGYGTANETWMCLDHSF
jgi:Gram-negative porin